MDVYEFIHTALYYCIFLTTEIQGVILLTLLYVLNKNKISKVYLEIVNKIYTKRDSIKCKE